MIQLPSGPRLLVEAQLAPVQGERFQPTGFPDIGAASFRLHDGTEMLLVESAQSMANRLERAAWDDGRDEIVECLEGLPYVRVERDGRHLTNSLLEAHRLNSPYILENPERSFFEQLQAELAALDSGPVDAGALAVALCRYDINCLLHGVFLAKKDLSGGRLRLPRALSAFVEARDVTLVNSGGVKNDRVDPSGDAAKGFGNVPFHRDEYAAREIVAYFNFDLAQVRTYRLDESVQRLIVLIGMWKIRRLLDSGLRLRTACDLELRELTVTRPAGFELPELDELEGELPQVIEAARKSGAFADPPVTRLRFDAPTPKKGKGKGGKKKDKEASDDDESEA